MCNRLMLKAAERTHTQMWKMSWVEVLSLASRYMCLRGSELGLLLQSERLILVTSSWVSNAVSA